MYFMDFIEKIKEQAKKETKIIALPEATDIRVLAAAERICKEKFAKVVLIGNEGETRKIAEENGIDIFEINIIDPSNSTDYELYVNSFYELRKEKGMTIEKAKELMLDPVYFGMMMVKLGKADGLVSGACHSTADTLRPALQILKTKPGTKLVSTFSIMVVPDCEYGDNGVFVFADCGLNANPNSEELAEIAISSAESYKQMVGETPKVAMLSFSTYGSASHEDVDKVKEGANLAKQKRPDLMIDGELQLDAAIVPKVGASKAPRK